MTVRLEELDQLTRALIREAEDDSMLNAMFRSVLGDATENRKPAVDGCVDRHQITGFEVRQDALASRRERHEVSPDVSLDAEREIEEGVSAPCTRPQSCEQRVQVWPLRSEVLRSLAHNLDGPGDDDF